MIVETLPAVSALSPPEKMLLASELWEQLSATETEKPLTRHQISELDRRMEHYRKHPNEVTTWDEIKARDRKSVV